MQRLKIGNIKNQRVKIILTFTLTVIGWSFFRANTVTDVIYLWKNAFTGISQPITYVMQGLWDLQMNRYNMLSFILPIFLLFLIDYATYKKNDILMWVGTVRKPIRYIFYIGVSYSTVAYYMYQVSVLEQQNFIYFQF